MFMYFCLLSQQVRTSILNHPMTHDLVSGLTFFSDCHDGQICIYPVPRKQNMNIIVESNRSQKISKPKNPEIRTPCFMPLTFKCLHRCMKQCQFINLEKQIPMPQLVPRKSEEYYVSFIACLPSPLKQKD